MLLIKFRILAFILIVLSHIINPVLAVAQNMIPYDTMIRVSANTLYDKEFWWAIKHGKWGILDSTKKEVVPCFYDIPYVVGNYYSRSWGDNCKFQVSNPVIMIKDSLVELVDLKKGVVSPASTKFLRFTDSFLVFKADNNKYGLLDKAGHILIPPISEMCIYQVFDSLLLLYYDSNYCYHDFENRAVKLPGNFREQDYRDVINFFIMKGEFNNRFHFQFNTVNIARKEFIPALIYFEEKYNETKFVSLKNMLDGFIGDYMDYCYVEGCFRYLTAFITDSIDCFQVDLDCGQNIFSTIDGPFNKVRGLGNGIVEYRNDELLASDIYVYRQISHFDYCRISGNKIDKLEFCDFFTPQSKALEKINACIDSLKNLVEFETLKLIEIENRMITENSNFSLGKDGITFWLNYLNDEKIGYPEDQFEITIPFNYLEEFIPENSLIDKIKKYFGKYE